MSGTAFDPTVTGRLQSPAGCVAPPGDYQSWDAFMSDVEALEETWEGARARRSADFDDAADISLKITKAMRLAPNLLVFRALLKGERVPADALDQEWMRRYRL